MVRDHLPMRCRKPLANQSLHRPMVIMAVCRAAGTTGTEASQEADYPADTAVA